MDVVDVHVWVDVHVVHVVDMHVVHVVDMHV